MTRLLCSKHQDEVGAIRNELLKAGIHTEIRSNPLAAALNVTRLELWVENERDYTAASRICNQWQAREKGVCEVTAADDSTQAYIDVDVLPTQAPVAESRISQNRAADGRVAARSEKGKSQHPANELEEARLLLEKEIEDLLQRETALSETCVALRRQVESLTRSLTESTAAAEKKATEFTALRDTLEREVGEHLRMERQLKDEVHELQTRLKSAEDAMSEKQLKLEKAVQQLQGQQATVVELRKEIVLREQEFEENKRMVSNAHAELALERERRLEAEEKAEKAVAAQERLASQLAEQKDLQGQMRASVESLKSLRGKLRAQKDSLQ